MDSAAKFCIPTDLLVHPWICGQGGSFCETIAAQAGALRITWGGGHFLHSVIHNWGSQILNMRFST